MRAPPFGPFGERRSESDFSGPSGPDFLPGLPALRRPYHLPMPARTRAPRSGGAATSRTPVAPEGTDAAIRVLRRFRTIFNAVKTHFRQVEKRSGIGGAQLWALSVIRAHPGIGVGDLAASMDVHQSTASNLVRSLIEAELVQAGRDGPDRRAVQLRVTPAGTQLLRKAPGPFAGVLPEALAQLDAAALERLDRDLGLLIALLQADERGAGIPLAQM